MYLVTFSMTGRIILQPQTMNCMSQQRIKWGDSGNKIWGRLQRKASKNEYFRIRANKL